MNDKLTSRIKRHGLGMANINNFSDQSLLFLLDRLDDIADDIKEQDEPGKISELEGERDHILVCLDDGITDDVVILEYIKDAILQEPRHE